MKNLHRYFARGVMCIGFLLVLMALAVVALIEALGEYRDMVIEAWSDFVEGWWQV